VMVHRRFSVNKGIMFLEVLSSGCAARREMHRSVPLMPGCWLLNA
jgi:hypothetical protein